MCANPANAFNCYWVMPFRKRARLILENLDDKEMTLLFQVNYALTPVPADAGTSMHSSAAAQAPSKQAYIILDGVKGRGQYGGTYLAWETRSHRWWGDGEIKFFLDGDKEFPTICGTGTEDYFCGSYNFEVRQTRQATAPGTPPVATKKYQTFSTPYSGLAQCFRRTRSTNRASNSACTDGTLRIPFASVTT